MKCSQFQSLTDAFCSATYIFLMLCVIVFCDELAATATGILLTFCFCSDIPVKIPYFVDVNKKFSFCSI